MATLTVIPQEPTTTTIPTRELVELRQQVNYWKTQHQRALAREAGLRETVERQARIIEAQAKEIQALKEENERIKAELALIKKMLFGDSQEKRREGAVGTGAFEDETPGQEQQDKRRRGQQKGTEGHGRKNQDHLPSREIFYDIPENEKHCPLCGKGHRRLNFTEDSDEITIEIVIQRILHRRYQYEPGCSCRNLPGLLVAEAPLKLFPKTGFSIDFWIHMLMEKFLYQRPTHRSLHHLRMEGLAISQGTITGGFEKIQPMVAPVWGAIVERSRQMAHWHMDETRWLVFSNDDDPDHQKRWWLWVMANHETCVYVIDPTRSRDVVLRHLGEDAQGIISSDRYSVYQNLEEAIIFAYCWAHLRRDFIRVEDSCKRLRAWAQAWIETVGHLYHLNNLRLRETPHSETFEIAEKNLRQAVGQMEETFEGQLQDPNLHPAAQKVLESLKKRWEGYCTFLDHPEIPMDNNFAERQLRNPVVGRKNYYGSGALWSATLSASMFTIFQTLILHQIHPRKFLKWYFLECAKNSGQSPQDIQPFLPWNLSAQQKVNLALDSS
jgi:transposase